MKEEKALHTEDPVFPKVMWPTKQLCPSCYHSLSRASSSSMQIDWNEDEVFHFLVNHYGNILVSSHMDSSVNGNRNDLSLADDIAASTNAVAVPIGAALGIALASCAFGALACFWRAQQKNRKYLHHLHSLKNI